METVDYITEDESRKQVRQFDKPSKKEFVKKEKVQSEVTEEVVREEKPVEEKVQKIDLTILTVNELRDLAKKKEVKGYSKMKKEELIEILK